ncbi:uncharacterized protein LACBIDRAFT_306342 [Laccaria bicolor S238N-H82]|uniref:Predicted protein n=1 Tax=Laccaria bicolor (strain S238N-H82 / ATCC MYA-4686) TaxID=486041 RepID=B0DN61_LACBS|nr:uncharacterized protein LACBIDRAFT_306342 [Laccaria bicolor S238N-H82]EDR03999.1 predicted protein [Laccaria bicolor S238N-H82]|eukprot:XP_001885254.1 predicted protein [Laccaria bicolor S238N-H82]
MSRNGSTWSGTLPTLRKIFRIPKPLHPSFGRFKRFVRRRERRPAQSPPPLATPEGNLNLSRPPSSVFSGRAVTNYGGPSTSQASPSAHSFLPNLQPLDALGPQLTDYSEESVVPQPSCPRMYCVSLPSASPSPELPSIPSIYTGESAHGEYYYGTIYNSPLAANDDEPTNEQYQDMTRQSSASSYHTRRESLSPQREHQPEMVPETLVSSIAQTIISDYFKPSKLVIDRKISLIDMQSVLYALRNCLQDLTIGPIGVGQLTSPSATAAIDLRHLSSLKVNQVDFSCLKELLASVRMDSLTTLDLLVGSLEVVPHELNLGWSRLTDVILHDNFYPEVLDDVMGSLRDVTRLKWSGELAVANHKKYSYDLKSLQDLSVCSNEDGCTFFLKNIRSMIPQTLHLSHFSPFIRGRGSHGLLGVRNLSIEHKIDADQFLSVLHHFPALSTADFGISGTTMTEKSGWLAMQQQFAGLESLTLRSVSSPIRPLLMPISLSKLKSLVIIFDFKSEVKHQFCSGLADCLKKEEKLSLESICLVDAHITQRELRSVLEIASPTLLDYQIRQTRTRLES